MKSDQERLLDIKEAIERIEKYSVRGKKVFEKDELIQNWIIHHLQIIGEAANRLSENHRKRYPGTLWTKIIGMRNILVHNYFGIDTAIVWMVVEHDLPVLKRNINDMLKNTS